METNDGMNEKPWWILVGGRRRLGRALAEAFTKAAADILDVRPEWVTILIEEYERENWATGGALHADKFGPGFGKDGTGGGE